jgi:CHAD domain-containing protein
VREALQRLSRLQNILGSMNDAAMADDLAAQVCRGRRTREVLEVRSILLGWNRAQMARLRGELAAAWHTFRQTPPFW